MPGRDDAHQLDRLSVLVHLSCGVRHHEKETALDLSKRLPALLAIHDTILHGNKQRVEEHLTGFLKTDAVLMLV